MYAKCPQMTNSPSIILMLNYDNDSFNDGILALARYSLLSDNYDSYANNLRQTHDMKLNKHNKIPDMTSKVAHVYYMQYRRSLVN